MAPGGRGLKVFPLKYLDEVKSCRVSVREHPDELPKMCGRELHARLSLDIGSVGLCRVHWRQWMNLEPEHDGRG